MSDTANCALYLPLYMHLGYVRYLLERLADKVSNPDH